MLKKFYGFNIKQIIWFFYPLIVVAIVGWFLIPYTKPFLKEVIAFGLLSSIFLCFALLFKNLKIRGIVSVLLTFILSTLAFTKLSFYYHYGVKLSASALFVIFETNATESAEFLNYYLNNFTFLLATVLFVPWLVFSWVSLSQSNSSKIEILNLKWIQVGIVSWIIIAGFIIHKKFDEFNIIYTGFSSYSEYQETKKILQNTLALNESNYIDVESSLSEEQTYIVVIGESTSTWHMQLYGYNRETNPLLTEIKDDLIVFSDVITPNVHTILALDKILTLSDFDNPNAKENASLVQMANQAGFTTYWISNQRPVGLHESMSTIIGNAADHAYFLATDNYNSTIYDDIILPKLNTVLDQPDKKKMVFIHLIGTHSDYKKRYPDSFKKFSGKNERTLIQNSKAEKIVNEYDNAVLFNDYIVRNIIEAARKENKMSYVIYFSDHGDEVFDTMDLMGHNEYHATKPMHEVPLILWMSNKYKSKNPISKEWNQYVDRKYNLEDFIHSFSDLSEIKFNLYDSTRSIFNSSYQKRIRWIKKDEDFDNR